METISTVADVIQRPMASEAEVPPFIFELDIDEHYFLILSLCWLAVLIWWLLLNLYIYKQNVTLLQKILTVIPVLKFLSAISYYLFLKQSPWITDENEFFSKYLIMTLVTISSIFQSFIIGIIMVLSSGWSLLHFHMSRDYSTRVTVSMGITYLSYSAYYVSMPNSPFRIFMECFITFMYTYIFIFCIKFAFKALWITERLIVYMENSRVRSLVEVNNLKYSMLRNYLFISVLFFFGIISFQGVIPMILEYFSHDCSPTIDCIQDFYDLLTFGFLLFNFRVRNWPDYFTIASLEIANLNQLLVVNRKTAEMYLAEISPHLLDSIQSCKEEHQEIIMQSSKYDSESNLKDLNVLLINPSYEEEYKEVGYSKMNNEGHFFSHLAICKSVKPSRADEE